MSYSDGSKSAAISTAMVPAASAGHALFEDLRWAIETGRLREGDRIAPISELAAKYQIAFETARATVGKLEKMSLVLRRRGAGTFVTARSRPRAKAPAAVTPTVGILMASKAHVFDHLAADLVDLFQQQGLTCTTLGWREDMGIEQLNHVFETWRQQPPRAVVVQLGPEGIDKQIDQVCRGKSAIIVTFRSPMSGMPYSSVNPDNAAAHLLAAETLLDRGHRRLGFVTTPRVIRPEYPLTQRKRTSDNTQFMLSMGDALRRRGIARHGLTFFHNVVTGSDERTGLATLKDVDRAARWLQTSRPTAVLGSDFRLVLIRRAAESLGWRIGPGGDLELIGLGNSPWSQALGFDSISFREDLIAKHIAKLILDPLGAPNETAHQIVVAPNVIVRTPAHTTVS